MAKRKRKPLSRATKKKISEVKRQRYLERLVARDPENEPTQRRCPRCEVLKSVEDFGTRKQKLKCGVVQIVPRSNCRKCEAERVAEWKQRKVEEGTWMEFRRRKEASRDRDKQRQYDREYKAAKRREMGVKQLAPRIPPTKSEEYVSVLPLKELLASLPETRRKHVAELSGIHERKLFAIEHEEIKSVKLRTVDAIFTALGCPEEMLRLYPAEEVEEPVIGYQVLDPKGVLKPFQELRSASDR